jgi:hypothetical protein
MMLTAVHLVALAHRSTPEPQGDWLNWTIG